jgi:hypothetical protein
VEKPAVWKPTPSAVSTVTACHARVVKVHTRDGNNPAPAGVRNPFVTAIS